MAAALGLPYAFASHFAPQMMMEAIDLNRHSFEPPEQLDRPYMMLGYNTFVADNDDGARLLLTSIQQAFVALRSGKPTQLPPPVEGFAETLPASARATLAEVLSYLAIGSPETAARQMRAFVEQTGADELVVTSQIYDHAARLRSLEFLAQAGQTLCYVA